LSSAATVLSSRPAAETTRSARYLKETNLSLADQLCKPRFDLFGLGAKRGRPRAESPDRHHRQSILDDVGASLSVT
jgi:hypothetical protein